MLWYRQTTDPCRRRGIGGDLIQLRRIASGLASPRIASSRDDDFLIQPAEKGLLAPPGPGGGRQPVGDLVTPQIQRERLERREQGPPQIAKRMPPARQRIVDNNDLASRPDHAEGLAQRPLAMRYRLLVQQEKQQRPIIAGVRKVEIGGIHRQPVSYTHLRAHETV